MSDEIPLVAPNFFWASSSVEALEEKAAASGRREPSEPTETMLGLRAFFTSSSKLLFHSSFWETGFILRVHNFAFKCCVFFVEFIVTDDTWVWLHQRTLKFQRQNRGLTNKRKRTLLMKIWDTSIRRTDWPWAPPACSGPSAPRTPSPSWKSRLRRRRRRRRGLWKCANRCLLLLQLCDLCWKWWAFVSIPRT